jgi:Flp pilus assembly protein TadD
MVPLQAAFDGTRQSDPNIANALALAKLLAGDPQGALALAEYSQQLAPDRPQTLLLLGRAYDAAGDVPAARAVLEKAHGTGQAGPEVLVQLGELSRRDGDLSTAIQYYRQAVEGGQVRDWQVVFNLGLLYRDQGDLANAAQWLQLAGRMAPPEMQATIQQAMDAMVQSQANPELPTLPGNPAPGEPGSPFILPTPPASP